MNGNLWQHTGDRLALMAQRNDLPVKLVSPSPVRPTWMVVLAAGEGARLSTLTRNSDTVSVPKQFCSLTGGATLLQETLRRARAVVPDERVTVIVAEQHRRWWQGALQSIPSAHTIVQPSNRGTANGVLLAALTIGMRDPLARVVFLPSDHYVHQEAPLARALHDAASGRLPSGELLLLGVEPNGPDPELGYVVPRSPSPPQNYGRVGRFVEKPSASTAAALITEGALWNSFIFAAEVTTITDLVRSRHPTVVDAFETALARGLGAVAALYDRLLTLDFSRDILQGAEPRLSVLQVPECGWSDLGTPRRVAACLGRLSERPLGPTAARSPDVVNLAAALTSAVSLPS